jgi:hypothetical protein
MSWQDTLKTLAPTIASALGGPLAGAAVTALGSAFGISEPTQEKIGKLFADGQLRSDHLAELRKLELDYANQEKERGFKYAELEFKDTDSARKMRAETHSIFPEILSSLVTVGFFGILATMMHDKTLVDSAPIMIMLGSLGAAFGAVINFWLGSNKGSDRTKELLAHSSINK